MFSLRRRIPAPLHRRRIYVTGCTLQRAARPSSTIVSLTTVLAICTFDGTVVRLRKSFLHPHSDSFPPISNENGGQDADDPAVDFQEHVSAEFLPYLGRIQVERAWLEKMVSIHDEKRPAKRRAEDRIDLKCTRAVLATDLIGSKGRAVEIKACLNAPPSLPALTAMMHAAEVGVYTQCYFSRTHPYVLSSRACVGSA